MAVARRTRRIRAPAFMCISERRHGLPGKMTRAFKGRGLPGGEGRLRRRRRGCVSEGMKR